jgi:hypothetical protein
MHVEQVWMFRFHYAGKLLQDRERLSRETRANRRCKTQAMNRGAVDNLVLR